MKKIILMLLAITTSFIGNAQEKIMDFQLSGYKAVFIPSDTFFIKIGHPELGNIEKSKGVLSLTLKDSQGRMPKDTVWIYTDQIRHINLNFSEIDMNKPFDVDSLSISITSSHGSIHVKANYLKVSAKAGSHLNVKGKTNYFECQRIGYSSINTDELQTASVQEVE